MCSTSTVFDHSLICSDYFLTTELPGVPPPTPHASDCFDPNGEPGANANGMHSPMEAHSAYRGEDWSPERLMFHQNLESFAERVGLIVGLQSNGKLSQEKAYAEIRKVWKELKSSKGELL